MITISYIDQKLSVAVEQLVKGTSNIQDRLDSAASSMFTLEVEDFPTVLQEEFTAICRILNNEKGVKGLFHSTTNAMSDEEALECAQRLYELFLVIRRMDILSEE